MWFVLFACTPPTATSVSDTPPATPYAGGWPVYADKGALEPPPPGTTAEIGARVPRFVAPDQHGELVDLYDFAGESLVLLDFSAMWCGPCNGLSHYLSTGEDLEPYTYGADHPELGARVDAGAVRVITILREDVLQNPADAVDAADWDSEYPHPRIPVLADTTGEIHAWADHSGVPAAMLLDDGLLVVAFAPGDAAPALEAASAP